MEVDVSRENSKTVETTENEAEELVHGSFERRLRELEKREKDAERRLREVDERERVSHERMMELVTKERALSAMREGFIKEIELVNEKLREQEKLGFRSIEKLDVALQVLERMKTTFDDRFRAIESWEAVTYESMRSILSQADLAREAFEKLVVELGNREKEFSLSENKETLIRDFLAWHKLRDSRDGLAGGESKEKPSDLHLRQCVMKKEHCTGAGEDCVKIDCIEGKNEECLDLTADEMFKILSLSSDTAKSVLEALQKLHSSNYLEKVDAEINIWSKYALLLYQLYHKSPNIKPCVREAANELAMEWKSKMKTCAVSDSMTFGFLLFLAIYDLPHCLDEDELLVYLKKVIHRKEALELCRRLGSSDTVSGFIQNILNKKQYLLASTYIHECQLQHTFPQSNVLNHFVKHSKSLAKAKCRSGNNSCEAQVEAINGEMADLVTAIKHIKKYGLQFDYSPLLLKRQLRKLAKNRANLMKEEIQSSSNNMETFPAPTTLPQDNIRKRLTTDSISDNNLSLLAQGLKNSEDGYENSSDRVHKQHKTNSEQRPVETNLCMLSPLKADAEECCTKVTVENTLSSANFTLGNM